MAKFCRSGRICSVSLICSVSCVLSECHTEDRDLMYNSVANREHVSDIAAEDAAELPIGNRLVRVPVEELQAAEQHH